MNYIKQLNAFYSTLEYNPLSANAISLYHAMLNVNNKCGWIAEFKVSNTVLCGKSGLSIASLQRARNELTQNNLVKYKKGSNKTIVSRYCFVVLYGQVDVQAGAQASNAPRAQVHVENLDTLNKHKQKKNLTTTKDEVAQHNAIKEFSSIEKTWTKAGMGMMSTSCVQTLVSYLDDGMDVDCILFAIQQADLNGARNLAYVKSILNRLMKSNIKTKAQLDASVQEFKMKKRGATSGDKAKKDPYDVWK